MTHVRSIWTLLAAAPLLVMGCRSSDPSTPTDSHVDSSSGIDSPASGDGGNACATYTTTSIAALRMRTHLGCFELDNVISIGTTPSTKSPKLYVQDAAGGDFSAIQTKCSSTSTSHPCSVAAAVAAIPDGHSVTIKGTFIRTTATTFEEFFIDSIVDNGAGTAPAPAVATLADIERSGTATNLRFQKVTVTVAAADTLKMYDWTPSEFVFSGATKCPFQFAFAMIPKSASGVTTEGAACAGSASQPAGQATPNPAEVLIGTDFFKGFTVSSDCRCAKTFTDTEPAAASTLVGPVSGILVFDVPFGGTTGYYYLAPKTLADAPISGTVAGM